ncbi:MAG: ferrous iron transport protein A [Spirochaetaceae bacterium]|nr:ferrous iron transport protein A [Spirochaetaceae bacterium]MBO5235572.1 ferrous iron transport protein A [Spirochaetaceae bacterium]
MPLAMLSQGESRTITSLSAAGEMKQHLNDMGFIPGQTVTVMGESNSGLILQIKGTRLALNRGLAQKILVS